MKNLLSSLYLCVLGCLLMAPLVSHGQTICVRETKSGYGGALPPKCFTTMDQAQSYVHTELAPNDGSLELQQTGTTIVGSEIHFNYSHGDTMEPAQYDFSFYVGIKPGHHYDCNSIVFGTLEGCGSETSLANDMYNYEIEQGYKVASIDFDGQYLSPPYTKWSEWFPSGYSGNAGLIMVDAQNSRIYTITPPKAENPEDQLEPISGPVLRTDIYSCPAEYGSDSAGNWPNVCEATPKRYISVDASNLHQYACCEATVGNPIVLANGTKRYDEALLKWSGLKINLHYTSADELALNSGIGNSWSRSLSDTLWFFGSVIYSIDESGNFDIFQKVNEKKYRSVNVQGKTITKAAIPESTEKGAWRLENGRGRTLWFNDSGRLVRLEHGSAGYVLDYCGHQDLVLMRCAAEGDLKDVASASGRKLKFYYQKITAVPIGETYPVELDRLTSISSDLGKLLTFNYTSHGLLESIDYGVAAEVHGFQYVYGEQDHLCKQWDGSDIPGCSAAFLAGKLTGVLDPDGNRFATYSYDGFGRATRSEHGSGAGAVGAAYGDSAAMAMLPSGELRAFSFDRVDGVFNKPTATAVYDFSGALKASFSSAYSGNRIDYKIDGNGHRTAYSYEPLHLVAVTEGLDASGSTTPESRTRNYHWDSDFNTPTQVSLEDASGVTQHRAVKVLNARGQIAWRCEVDDAVAGAASYECGSAANAPSGVRQISYSYCELPDLAGGICPVVGLPIAIDGPRTDVADITEYFYYQQDDATCGYQESTCLRRHGDLWKVTNALGQTTEFLSYDSAGRPLKVKSPNGVITEFGYSVRGWPSVATVYGGDAQSGTDDSVIRIEYGSAGFVTKVTQPDGAYLSYTYDDAHRLIKIADNLGNVIDYCPGGAGSAECLDAAGNRRVEQTRDPNGAIKRAVHHVYDQLGHLKQTLNAANQPVFDATDGFDGNGNLTHSGDGRGIVTEQQYDPLDRLMTTIQDVGGTDPGTADATTSYTYNARDQLHTVTDSDNLTTTYAHDGLGNLTQLDSPDTGTTIYHYDLAGNRTDQTDARGVETDYTYDALNRLTAIHYPGNHYLDVAYTYDVAPTECATTFAVGHVSVMADASGSTSYCYDRRGNVTDRYQTVKDDTDLVIHLHFSYNVADRLMSVDYGEGAATVFYDRDSTGRIQSVTTSHNGVTTPLVAAIDYLPFGPANTYQFASGAQLLLKTYDQNYQVTDVEGSVSGVSSALNLHFRSDVMGNITAMGLQPGVPVEQEGYAYDALGRVQTINSTTQAERAFTYTPTGDRLSDAVSGQTTKSYSYQPASHHLVALGGVARSVDVAGHTTAIGAQNFIYANTGRLAGGQSSTPTNSLYYVYDARGQRVLKGDSPYPTSIAADGSTGRTVFSYLEDGRLAAEYRVVAQCDPGSGRDPPGTFLAAPEGAQGAGGAGGAKGADHEASLKLSPRPASVAAPRFTCPADTILAMHLDLLHQYVWADSTLVAVSDGTPSANAWRNVYTDQLGTPRAITDQSGTVIWRWARQKNAFGERPADEDPDGNGTQFNFNLRFPGQYFDAETGLHYNYFRDYEPGTGRYLESDQLGLIGGPNVYSYVGGNPLVRMDPLGLYCLKEWEIRGVAGATVGAAIGGVAGSESGPGAAITAVAGALINGGLGVVDGLLSTSQFNGAAAGAAGAALSGGTKLAVAGAMSGGAIGGAVSSKLEKEGYPRTIAVGAGGVTGGSLSAVISGYFKNLSVTTVVKNGIKGGAIGMAVGVVQTGLESAIRAGNDCGCSE